MDLPPTACRTEPIVARAGADQGRVGIDESDGDRRIRGLEGPGEDIWNQVPEERRRR